MPHLAVFCTTDIPAKTLNNFLRRNEEYLGDLAKEMSWDQDGVDECIYIVKRSQIPDDPVGPTPPMKAFKSPWKNKTLDEIRGFFLGSITPHEEFLSYNFVVLDSQTPVDNTCLLCCVTEESQEVQTVRCDFYVPYSEATSYEFGSEPFDSGIKGAFRRSKIVLTRESRDIADKGGFLLVDGVLKLDEDHELAGEANLMPEVNPEA